MYYRFAITLILLWMSPAYATPNLCPSLTSNQAVPDILGIATHLQSGENLYCEYHFVSDDKKTVVDYIDFNQQLIARKYLDYSLGEKTPLVKQQDFRHGELRAVTLTQGDDAQQSQLTIQYRKANTDETSTSQLAFSDSLVIDAGFDAAVRQQWNALVNGEAIQVDFVSPVHLKSFKLSIVQSQSRKCKQQLSGNDQGLCFLIRPANALARLFVKPLVLIYDQSSQRLLSYTGSVNITSLEGASKRARIEYHYN
ncbi:MAG: hypothetical protein AAFZ92_07210 [Pseudomonadota bacterium]